MLSVPDIRPATQSGVPGWPDWRLPVSQPPSVGGKPDSHPEVVWSWWIGGTRHEDIDLESALSAAKNGEGFVWVGLHKPTEGTVATLGEVLNIHQLVITDAVHGHRRSKLEQFDENLFMVASTVSYVERDEQQTLPEIVSTGELMIILGRTDWSPLASAANPVCPRCARWWRRSPATCPKGLGRCCTLVCR